MQQLDSVAGHEIPNWVATGIGAIIASLGSTVVFLFKRQSASDAKVMAEKQKSHDEALTKLETHLSIQEKRSENCEKDRMDLRIRLAELSTRMDLAECKAESE